MKYDLLFSDIVASFAGIFGLLAAAITLQKAMLHWSNGDPMVATNMTVFALLLFDTTNYNRFTIMSNLAVLADRIEAPESRH